MMKWFSLLWLMVLLLQYGCLVVPPAASSWVLPKEREFIVPSDKNKQKRIKEAQKTYQIQKKRQKLKEQFQSGNR